MADKRRLITPIHKINIINWLDRFYAEPSGSWGIRSMDADIYFVAGIRYKSWHL